MVVITTDILCVCSMIPHSISIQSICRIYALNLPVVFCKTGVVERSLKASLTNAFLRLRSQFRQLRYQSALTFCASNSMKTVSPGTRTRQLLTLYIFITDEFFEYHLSDPDPHYPFCSIRFSKNVCKGCACHCF